MITLRELATREAVQTVLSDLADMTPDEIISSLENGEIPNDIYVWEVFDGYDADMLHDLIQTFVTQFEGFGRDILARGNSVSI